MVAIVCQQSLDRLVNLRSAFDQVTSSKSRIAGGCHQARCHQFYDRIINLRGASSAASAFVSSIILVLLLDPGRKL